MGLYGVSIDAAVDDGVCTSEGLKCGVRGTATSENKCLCRSAGIGGDWVTECSEKLPSMMLSRMLTLLWGAEDGQSGNSFWRRRSAWRRTCGGDGQEERLLVGESIFQESASFVQQHICRVLALIADWTIAVPLESGIEVLIREWIKKEIRSSPPIRKRLVIIDDRLCVLSSR